MSKKILGLIFMSVTSYVAAAPSWISEVEKNYPRALYLSAVASADTLETARQRALSSLAQSVRVRVNSQTETASMVTTETRGKKTIATENNSIRDNTQLLATLEIPGAETPKVEFDSKEQVYYALAIADKSKLRRTWQSDLQNWQTKAQDALSAAASEEQGQERAGFAALKKLRDAKTYIAQMDELTQNLSAIGAGQDPNMESASKLYSQALQREDQIKKKLKIALMPMQATPATTNYKLEMALRSALQENLGVLGLKISKNAVATRTRANAEASAEVGIYVLHYDIDLQAPFERDGNWWQLGRTSLELRLGEDVIAEKTQALKVGAASRQTLTGRVQSNIKKQVNENLPALLFNDSGE